MRESALESASWDVQPAPLVREFLPLDRRRIHANPPLDAAELARWEELRDLLEIALGSMAAAPGETRRRALRVRTHLKVLVGSPLAQELLIAHEVSEHGVFLRTQRPSAPGSLLQIEFQDRRGRAIELEGRVVWARRIGDGNGPPGMGVAFHALSEWERAVLSEFVETTLAALG